MRAEAEAPSECAEIALELDAYVDGELLEAERGEVERHLAGCTACTRKARSQGAFKAALKAAVTRPAMPAGLRDRLVLQIERTRPEGIEPRWRAALRKGLPAAAAAVAVATLLGTTHGFSPVAAEAISNHARQLPIEVAGPPEVVGNWIRPKVDFAVRVPSMPSATLVGARLTQIHNRQAAYLVYDVGGSRVSLFVFDPADMQIDARRHRFAGGGREIYLDDQRGYHVALVRNGGLGYAFASDMDDEHMFQLVSATLPR